MSLTKELKNFISKILGFFVLFIVISGIVGPWVIRTKLLYGFYFFIYGNLGKVLIIATIALFFLIKDRFNQIKPAKFSGFNVFLIFCSFLLLPLFFYLAKILLNYTDFTQNIVLALLTHAVLLLSIVLLALGVFSRTFFKEFFALFKKEIMVCFFLSIFMYFMIFQVWKLWPYFSGVVLNVTYSLLSLTFPNTQVILPLTLKVNSFAVIIAQACSGVDSLFLFTCLYWFFGIVDWKEFNKNKLVFMFIPAALGLFLVNILRIYLLMVIGAFYSREIALQLFHTYAGMVLFILYFLTFWSLAFKWLRK